MTMTVTICMIIIAANQFFELINNGIEFILGCIIGFKKQKDIFKPIDDLQSADMVLVGLFKKGLSPTLTIDYEDGKLCWFCEINGYYVVENDFNSLLKTVRTKYNI